MSPAGSRRNGTRKFGTAGIGRLLEAIAPRPDDNPGGPEGHLPRHAVPKAASRKRTVALVAGVAVAATLTGGAVAYGLSAGNSQDASLDAMMTASSDGHLVSGSGALAADGAGLAAQRGHADSIAASLSHSRPAAVRHPAPPSKAPASKASASKAPASKAPAARHAPAKPAAFTLSCDTASGKLPANMTKIVGFLLAHGYSHNAAAGIAGNIYQESKGNPELQGMGGGGLIGFTPLPAGYVTGDVAADLQTQLHAVLAFNEQWAGYLPALNGAATPAAAADVYVTKFERAGIPAAGTREAAAQDVASACGL